MAIMSKQQQAEAIIEVATITARQLTIIAQQLTRIADVLTGEPFQDEDVLDRIATALRGIELTVRTGKD
jgi:hypothetical protein